MKRLLVMTLMLALSLLLACEKDQSITLVTTTSVENSGLLHYLTPHFEENAGFEVDVVAKGTGAAIKLAEDGQADVLLVHDREKELAFMDEGYGEKRHELMYNHFIFLGP
ncbi:MAG: substrate-binding domain-containing protein, partial [Bacillota bacterium]